MGASTTAQLIAKGKAENGYNNAGISSDNAWLDFFNDALRDLVDELNIQEVLPTITHDGLTREHDLPADYYSLIVFNDGSNNRIVQRRNYDQQYPPGYWVLYKGSKYVLDLYNFSFANTFAGLYQRYAKALSSTTDTPEVPSVGERALVYYAISKALYNNNQMGQGQEYEKKYEQEKLKIRTAASRARGQ
ncbi:hypothetical protein QFZ77_002453 [Paenibacillus sp. V4I3]|uniref:phage adaptor protein n=1 Tax=Paenibacillus sp. V4I3 TaxID=3042305 RepID=UPI002781E186|nr:hypothetical protein [Paenibacillus sp. V4I3]MDQ0873794.1 hypothetical protein [Paenibacillus sp. V4I3]